MCRTCDVHWNGLPSLAQSSGDCSPLACSQRWGLCNVLNTSQSHFVVPTREQRSVKTGREQAQSSRDTLPYRRGRLCLLRPIPTRYQTRGRPRGRYFCLQRLQKLQPLDSKNSLYVVNNGPPPTHTHTKLKLQ